MVMTSVEHWKKRIIEKFIERSSQAPYHITDMDDILNSFGDIEFTANTAWDELVADELLVVDLVNDRRVIFLNSNKQLEIMEYFNQEPVDEVRAMLEPPSSTFDGLDRRLDYVTENAWPNQGTYYLCTRVGDPADWVSIYRSKPHKKPTRVNLGSLRDNESRIVKMWRIICDVGGRGNIFYKKQAEDRDQRVFGNNRQPATAAFCIFTYLGWIREVSRHGRRVTYALDNTSLYDALANNRGYVCHECARVCLGGRCDNCQGSPTQ